MDTRLALAPRLMLLALACLLAYAPALMLPLIEDDYPIITEAQFYGSPAGFGALVHTPVFRSRATSYWTINALWQVAQLRPWAFHAASLALHIINTWLVFALGLLWPRMRAAAFWAALFFAVQEGHQEAVMWFTAINELLQFAFGIGALVCWMAAPASKRRWLLEAAALLLFVLALISKESAVILPAFFLLATPPSEWRRAFPYLALSGAAAAAILLGHTSSYRFNDGSFSLHAPFWITWPRGIGRVLWIWGFAAAAFILFRNRQAAVERSGLVALIWIAIALVPYSFLTYSTQIPSRQTYLATVGLAFLVGLALANLKNRRLLAAAVVLIVIHNVGYLWTRKRNQFLARAAPTEQLIRLARRTSGPILMRCFPRSHYIAEEAVHVAAGHPPGDLLWTAEEAASRKPVAEFCYK